jgi:hypothetical protein
VGFEAARQVLQFVLSLGLRQQSEWEDQAAGKVVRVNGAIPVTEVLDHFQTPEHYLPAVNRFEASAGQIRIAGPSFEEYLISSS